MSIFCCCSPRLRPRPWWPSRPGRCRPSTSLRSPLPNCPPGEIRFEETRDVVAVDLVLDGPAPDALGLSYLQDNWPKTKLEQCQGPDPAEPVRLDPGRRLVQRALADAQTTVVSPRRGRSRPHRVLAADEASFPRSATTTSASAGRSACGSRASSPKPSAGSGLHAVGPGSNDAPGRAERGGADARRCDRIGRLQRPGGGRPSRQRLPGPGQG